MKNTRTVEDMSPYERSRWYALISAIDIIDSECIDRRKNFTKTKISPIALQKYIESTHAPYIDRITTDPEA